MTFDAQSFMNATAGAKVDDQFELPAEGEYLAQCEKVDEPVLKTSKKGNPFITCTITWRVLDEQEKARLGRDNILVRQQIFLDTKDDGSLDFGRQRNIALGQIFTATGMNDGTGSLGRIAGQMAKIQVKHRPDDRNPDRVFAEVNRVTRA